MGVSTLGKPIPQVNALAKVLGRSKYAGDIHLPGMLHGKVLRSPHAHARIVHINIVAVAATTEDIARDALDLIDIEYEVLPAQFDPSEALSSKGPEVHKDRNIAHDISFHRGDVDQAFASAHLVHEATYSTHAQYPGYLEPMATVARIDADGRLEVWTSTQPPSDHWWRLWRKND